MVHIVRGPMTVSGSNSTGIVGSATVKMMGITSGDEAASSAVDIIEVSLGAESAAVDEAGTYTSGMLSADESGNEADIGSDGEDEVRS